MMLNDAVFDVLKFNFNDGKLDLDDFYKEFGSALFDYSDFIVSLLNDVLSNEACYFHYKSDVDKLESALCVLNHFLSEFQKSRI